LNYRVKRVVFALHVGVADAFAENVLVEGSGEVALEQFVVVDGLGDDATDKFEVTQVIRVAVRGRVDHISDAVTGRCGKERVHRVEDLARYYDVPER